MKLQESLNSRLALSQVPPDSLNGGASEQANTTLLTSLKLEIESQNKTITALERQLSLVKKQQEQDQLTTLLEKTEKLKV